MIFLTTLSKLGIYGAEDCLGGPLLLSCGLDVPRGEADYTKLHVPSLDNDGQSLLRRLLLLDPGQRISAAEACAHTYFKAEKNV